MKPVAVIVDSSVWIDYLDGEVIAELETATAEARLLLSPLAVAEVLSGDVTPRYREMVGWFLQEFPMHPTPLAHWLAVADLRRLLRFKGVNVTLPDAHIAQCALDVDATLVTRDDIFLHIAKHTPLRLR
jgi:predicted nucleic acid-binding protein